MSNRALVAAVSSLGLLLLCQAAAADAPLKSVLGLDTDQAAVVSEIEAKYRSEMRGVRQDRNREARKLRRARTANDSELIAKQEAIVQELEASMRRIILGQDDEIRKVLTPEQLEKFEAHIEKRDAMVGSSRDVNVLDR